MHVGRAYRKPRQKINKFDEFAFSVDTFRNQLILLLDSPQRAKYINWNTFNSQTWGIVAWFRSLSLSRRGVSHPLLTIRLINYRTHHTNFVNSCEASYMPTLPVVISIPSPHQRKTPEMYFFSRLVHDPDHLKAWTMWGSAVWLVILPLPGASMHVIWSYSSPWSWPLRKFVSSVFFFSEAREQFVSSALFNIVLYYVPPSFEFHLSVQVYRNIPSSKYSYSRSSL